MLSLAETALEGTDVACGCETGVEPVVVVVTGVAVALLPQATNAIVRKIISPAIDRRQPRFVCITLFMICESPVLKIVKLPV
jgi:hypothetical protein